MGSEKWIVCCFVLLMAVGGAMAAAPKKPVDVPFGRNYVPTWAFDHIKYYNGGNEIQLVLDKYTGIYIVLPLDLLLFSPISSCFVKKLVQVTILSNV